MTACPSLSRCCSRARRHGSTLRALRWCPSEIVAADHTGVRITTLPPADDVGAKTEPRRQRARHHHQRPIRKGHIPKVKPLVLAILQVGRVVDVEPEYALW